ncbi:hypothetical protein LSCM1_05961 [Leishmania martiniquensis]|uniref:HECT domain-containing protein n=1 Tax=Leishmania martiniquensis TaxID=1580590 RepID=A0A836HTT5_9TRYP|nr:hypothetical protein LSCM1_05961 [Leishmania martiniquensis]
MCVLVAETRQPTAHCVGAASSSLAVTHTRVLLLTDRMASAEVALVLYGLQLDTYQVLRWAGMDGSWPSTLDSHPQLVSTTEDRVLVVYESHQQQAPPARALNGAAAAAGSPASAAASGGVARSTASQGFSPAAATLPSAEWTVMMHCYNAATASSLAAAPLWRRALHPAAAPAGLCLNRCLALRKPSLVDLGSPEEHLTVAGGQVTVELWVQFLDKEDAATLYQHGDRSTNGEVFLELTKSEGAYCIRGGYRHEMRGSCLVSAPLPPTAESRPFHVCLVFNGRWRLFFDGEEVAGNRQGPHVSLDSPKQRWTVGANCTCLLTGLRVWRLGRTAREVSRDYRRALVGDEPGLVAQLFFNEKSGNVVFNYVRNVKACHAVCSGAVAHKACDAHPWRSYGSGALGGGSAAAASASVASRSTAAGVAAPAAASSLDVAPVCARLHEWRDLAMSTFCATRHALIVRTPVSDDGPYALREGGHVLMFFDLATGVAHPSLFFLTSHSPVRHMMRADPQGRLWELFEVDAGLVKGEQEASYLLSLLGNPGSAPQRPRDRVLAMAPLPLLEDEEGMDNLEALANEGEGEDDEAAEEAELRDSSASTASESNLASTVHNAAASQANQTLSRLPSFRALVAQPSESVTYVAAALWLLKLLALHAETEPGVDQTLFSPLADDVGSRCVTEVRLILGEHFRVVKSHNARRAMALKSSVSWVVVAAALRVLLRLVRRARAFGLHPTPLGLTVVRESIEHDRDYATDDSTKSPAHISKATMALLLRELHASSLRRRASASVMRARRSVTGHPGGGGDGGGQATDSSTLLGLLGDIINEEGLTLSPDVVTLARTTTIEGVELFLPDVRHRAHLLRDLLCASSGTSTATGSAAAAASPSFSTEERVPAMEVLLNAVAQSFTTVLAAAPLLGVEDDSAEPGNAASLTELCETLQTLLEESCAQWRRLWATNTATKSLRKFATFATSLSEAVASLQLLLLSACQGSRWEVALSLMYACGGGNIANRLVDAGNVSDGGGQGDSRNGGNGAALSGVAGSGVSGVNGGGGPDSVAAAALDLQRLCFSQAAAHHPCVRAYYNALFDCTERCLSFCVQQPPQQLSADGTAMNAERGSGDSGTPLAMILSSLAPTFVSAPLHTALCAIPLILAAEDAVWFLQRLDQMLVLCETLLERPELPTRPSSCADMFATTTTSSSPVLSGHGGATSARRLVCSLREALFYASVWVAAFLFNSTAVSSASVRADVVRRRLGLVSVTTTPTTQRQTAQLTGRAASVAAATGHATETPPLTSSTDDGASAAVEEELARVWEHPLLEGGVWPSTRTAATGASPTLTTAGAPAATAPQSRAQLVAQLMQNTAYWAAKQAMHDPLATKSHPAMGLLITTMAAATLHLSAVPLQQLSPMHIEELMGAVMRKISRPVRTELLSRREAVKDDGSGGVASPSSIFHYSSGRQESLRQSLAELQNRCELLLQVRSCTELWAVEDALFCCPTEHGSPMVTPPPTCASAAMRSVWRTYYRRRVRFRAHAASHPSWTLHEATQLVMSVVLSRQITADLLHDSLHQREALASQRRTGIDYIFRLMRRAPHSAESAAQLLSAQGRGAHTHYEEGIGGGCCTHAREIRRIFFELLCWAMQDMPAQLGASGSAARCGGSVPPSMTSSAAVLCSLLDRSWRPRDFAFFVQLRVVPTMMEIYVTLFVVAKRAGGEEAAEAMLGTRSSGSAFGRSRNFTAAAESTASSSNTDPKGGAATVANSRVGSVELRHVNLTERQHRDRVIAAQQARRTSKSSLVATATLNQAGSVAGGGVAPHGYAGLMSGGNGDVTLQHTAAEVMQARVWSCFKSLALQSTAMLAPEHIVTMSRVEQVAVMTFLADMLGAIDVELRLCRDVLSRAVKETPLLLAQAGDTAVLQPLVTVQDQVDVLLSFLSVVGGTLCSASVSVDVSAPVGHTTAGGVPSARSACSDDGSSSAADGTVLFLSRTLSTVCATISETLLELVFLDLYHARAVSADTGVGCVVRDAAACARIAALLLCRCQPSAVRSTAAAPRVWKEMYNSTVFAKALLPASSSGSGGRSCLQTWLDLGMYALGTTGMSRTTQHVLLAFRRLLHQPAWAAELRFFASSYQALVHTYAASVLRSHSSGGEVPGAAGNAAGTDGGDDAASKSSRLSTGTPTRGRELLAIELYVWSTVLGGELMAPPTSPGASVTFLNEKDGFASTNACVVDIDVVVSLPSGVSGSTPAAAGRRIRGSSHLVRKTPAAEGERVRGVMVVPTDASGCGGNREEVQLSPNQLFLPEWDSAVVVPPYVGLVEEFLAPALRLCMPLLGEKLDTAGALSGLELTYFISLLQLTAGVARARPDLGRQLIQCGAMKSIRQYALQGTVRLPYPLKALRELGALVAVRAAEAAADRICAPTDSAETADSSTSVRSGAAVAATTSRAATSSLAAALAAVSATSISRSSAGPRSPFDSPGSAHHHTLPGVSEALLESLRGVLSGPSAGYPASLLAGFPSSGTTTPTPSGLLRDSNEYGLSRLARSLGVFGGAYGGASSQPQARTSSVSLTSMLSGGASLNSTTARVPPRTEGGSGSPTFLSFPMWPAHDGPPHAAAGLPYVPAAIEITPSRAGVHFPVWEDGFAIELAVLLTDGDMYPAMGDTLSVPCSWLTQHVDSAAGAMAPDFPLLTLYTSAGGHRSGKDPASSSHAGLFPFLQLSVQEKSLNVVVRIPPSTDGQAGAQEVRHCSAKRALRREDWHHCMHVSVMCNAQSLALTRNGEITSVEWGGAGGVGRCAEALLRQEDAIVKVVLGRASAGAPSAASPAPPREVDGPMALIGGVRLWSTSVLRTSLRVVAELVARDRALQSIGLQENMCYFDLKEGTGAVVESADNRKQFRGVLSGNVRWAAEPLPLGFYPSIELNSGNVRDGVAVPLASSTRVPRAAMAAFVDSLSSFYLERFGGDVLWSLLTLAARHATVTALEIGTSPAYTLHCLRGTPATSSVAAVAARHPVDFDPREVLDASQKVPYQLLRLFQLNDSGYLPNAHERLIHAVVKRLVAVLAAAEPEAARTTSQLCELVADTAHVLRQLRRDDSEIFVIEVPPPSIPAVSASASITRPVVLPLAFTNGGGGVLTFDAKYRNVEQATVYRDVELKNVIAKYPDGQGGWPACTLTAKEAPWAYLRSVPTSTGHRLAADGKAYSPGSTASSSIVTVTTKTLKPAILHAMVKAMCDALRRTAAAAAGVTEQGNHQGYSSTGSCAAERAAACLLDARVVVSLIQQSSARSSEDDCVHFVHILTTMMRLWRDMPHLQPYDQVPLSMAMSHLNIPLCSIIQHVNSDSDLGSLVSASTGTYSPYVQSLLGLLVSAAHADCAWAGRSYVEQLQGRWRRLWGMWQRAVVYRPSQFANATKKMHKSTAGGDSAGKTAPSALPSGDRRDGAAEASSASGSAFRALFLAPSSCSTRQSLQGGSVSAQMPRRDSLDASMAVAGSSTAEHATTESPVPESGDGGHADDDPLDSVSSPSNAATSGSGGTRAPPRVVELVAMQPSDVPHSPLLSSATVRHDGPPQQAQKHPRRPYPSGVSRKGNGLWVVRGTSAGKENGEEQNLLSRREGATHSVTTVRSSVGMTSGVFYWEVYVANISRAEHAAPTLGGGSTLASNIIVGVATERYVLTHQGSGSGSGAHAEGRDGFLGSDGESWGFDGGRALRCCRGYAVESSPRTRWKMDDVIGFVLDLPQNKLCCLHNGRLVSEFSDTFLSDAQRAARIAVFPVITCTGEAICEVNFGATGFASTPPPGCLPIDLSIYVSEDACRLWKVILADAVSAPIVSPAPASAAGTGGPARQLLSNPIVPLVGQHLTRFTQGRQGPLDVVLLSPDANAKLVTSRECKTDDVASLIFGSVAVTSGRWYFEVVLPTEPTFSVGWYACKPLEEQGGGGRGGASLAGLLGTGAAGGAANNRDAPIASPTSPARAQLGSDRASWAFDAGRMIARHNKHQISLPRRAWKCGDVVGCLLDCEAGTVSFSINGEFLKAAHGSGTTSGGGWGDGNVAGLGGMRGNSEGETTTATSSAVPCLAAAASASSTEDSAATALFSDVCMGETHGLVPAILLEPKSSLVCLWNEEELLFPPTEGGAFRALGGAAAVHDALVELITVTDPQAITRSVEEPADGSGRAGRKPRSEKMVSASVDAVALQKLLYYASKVQELHPASLRSYTMPSLYGEHDGPQSRDSRDTSASLRGVDVDAVTPSRAFSQKHQQRDLCSASGLDPASLQPHLMALLFFGHLATLLYPFAHPAALPVTVENAPLGNSWAFSEFHETLRACQRYSPPWVSLRVLQWSLDASNGAGDAVRLSVNRRKALTVVRDTTASVARRLRDSLFGQVYQLLASKPPSFFMTSKKLWTVSFYGEGADDVGGPYRECLTQMCAELMSTSLTLFLPSANMTSELGEVRDSYVVNPLCAPPLELHMYRFLGRLMGGCLRGGEPLSLYLPSALWKYLVGEAADDADMARVDIATLNALDYVEQVAGLPSPSRALRGSGDGDDAARNEELAELCPLGFSLLNDAGVVEALVPGGAQIEVTVANAGLYTHLLREHKLYTTGAAQRRALQQGFHEVVPLCSVSGLKWYELEELVCGQCDYDSDMLLDAARYEGMAPTDVRVRFLRRVLRGFTRHQRALFMRFVSGRERMPPGMQLKIMPDNTPRVTPIPPMTPQRHAPSHQQRSAASVSDGTTSAMITPQPPPSSEQRLGAAFVRHNTLLQGRTSSNAESTTLPPSPPQLGFTPPPAQAVSRMVPPPALQPVQLLPAWSSGNGAPSRVPASPRSLLGTQERHQQQGPGSGDGATEGEVDPSLCDDTRLPQASTCFYWLRLPCYSSASVMAQKLLFAIEQCVDIDADFRVHDTDVSQQELGPILARVSSDEGDLFEDFSHLR